MIQTFVDKVGVVGEEIVAMEGDVEEEAFLTIIMITIVVLRTTRISLKSKVITAKSMGICIIM